jgi:hypothetical protein
VLDKLKIFLTEMKEFRRTVKAVPSVTIGQAGIRGRAEAVGGRWCADICPQLKASGAFEPALLEKYTTQFSRLIKLSAPSNRKSSYLAVMNSVTKSFRKDFILPVQQGRVILAGQRSSFDDFLTKIAHSDEGDYFKEAISCARQGYFRAATVMGWCTAVDRIHRKIEEIGFPAFNVTSAQMASQASGRFKKFNQTQNVNSLGELREVFDTVILWIVEGMGLIDSNQHTRLRSCFDMRCQAAHPGEAPSTEYNLLSFFSDIEQIILSNPRFAPSRPSGPSAG